MIYSNELKTLETIFNKPATVRKIHGHGKWAGCVDHVVYLGDSDLCSAQNAEELKKVLQKKIAIYEGFAKNKSAILEELRTLAGSDNIEIEDVRIVQNSRYLFGWFYLVLNINGVRRNHTTTDLDFFISESAQNLPHAFPLIKEKYFIAGGLDSADYKLFNCGYNTQKELYTTEG